MTMAADSESVGARGVGARRYVGDIRDVGAKLNWGETEWRRN